MNAMNDLKTDHTNAAWHARRQAATPRGVGVMGDFFIDHAKNAEFWDIEGRRFIDFAGGIAVLNTGHVHPKVQAAIAAQLQRFTHSCYQVVPYAEYVTLAERINALVPVAGPAKTAFFSTGAEAVENAIKIARSATGRSGVIAFGAAFHGRSLFSVALTGKVVPYKVGFGPFPPEIYHVPFPAEGASLAETQKAMEQVFKCDIEPSRVAAIIFEPVQGEGGFNVAPPEFLAALRRICDSHGIVLIGDEIQAGMARTGRMFGFQHSGVAPDLVTMAKGLAGGFPLSAVTGRAEIVDAPAPGGLGGTYAGNPLAIAAALAVLEVVEDEDLCARAEEIGLAIRARLQKLAGRFPAIGDVRGLGAMNAFELVQAGDRSQPDPQLTAAIVAEAEARGLILLSCGTRYNVIRLLPPLTIPDAQLSEALAILEAAIEAALVPA